MLQCFSNWEEDWSLLEATYFSYVTLTTIGFGDFVPNASFNGVGDNASFRNTMRMIFSIIYISSGKK